MTEENRVMINHRSEVVCDVLDKLIGNISAVGETQRDDNNFVNLKVMDKVLYHVIEQLCKETSNATRYEYSVKRSGKCAISILEETREWINDTLEDIE